MESPTLSSKKTRILSLLSVNTSPASSTMLQYLIICGMNASLKQPFPHSIYLQTSWCDVTGLVSQAPAIPGDHWATPLPHPPSPFLSFSPPSHITWWAEVGHSFLP